MQPLGLPVVVAAVAALAAYGWRQGVYRATLAGLVMLVASVTALAVAERVAPLALLVTCPEPFALSAAVLAVWAGLIIVAIAAAGTAIRDDDLRLGRLPDKLGGAALGVVAGWLLAGLILVAWSMLPEPWVRKGEAGTLDAGAPLLRTVARCLAGEKVGEELLRRYREGSWREKPVEPPAAEAGPAAADAPPAAAAQAAPAPEPPAAPQPPVSPQP